MNNNGKAGSIYLPSLITNRDELDRMRIKGRWDIECRDRITGAIKWEDVIENLVTNVGLNHILSIVLASGTQITSWYVGLTSSSPTPAAGDTMASHAGWTEVHTQYDEANRVTWTPGSVSGQSVSNTASKAQFTINGGVTVGGAFLTSDNTKNGTSGTLFSIGAFSGGNRSLVSTDVLNVTATFTQADDGA